MSSAHPELDDFIDEFCAKNAELMKDLENKWLIIKFDVVLIN